MNVCMVCYNFIDYNKITITYREIIKYLNIQRETQVVC